jgi:predicted DNA-binding transcriptional regulator AlpA
MVASLNVKGVRRTMTRILRFKPDIIERTPIKNRVTLRSWINDPKIAFPAPTQYGPNTIGWPEEVVEEWLASRPQQGKDEAASSDEGQQAPASPR